MPVQTASFNYYILAGFVCVWSLVALLYLFKVWSARKDGVAGRDPQQEAPSTHRTPQTLDTAVLEALARNPGLFGITEQREDLLERLRPAPSPPPDIVQPLVDDGAFGAMLGKVRTLTIIAFVISALALLIATTL